MKASAALVSRLLLVLTFMLPAQPRAAARAQATAAQQQQQAAPGPVRVQGL